jgi:shikimate dehydrogenase
VSTRSAAVLGFPVAHSLSPVLHRAAYRALGLDWTYTAIECRVEDLPRVLAERADWAGFSCTMPLKRAALEIAAEVRVAAAEVGAANTLLPRPGGGWIADNTDVDGVAGALGHRLGATGAAGGVSVTLLGAGGTAQAAAVALARAGVTEAAVLVRDPARAEAVLATADRAGLTLHLGLLAPDAAALDADVVVSTLPPGAADPLATWPWRSGQAVLDVVYEPWPTPLAAAVGASGAAVISGAVMLLHQAAAQVRLMTGAEAPVEEMAAALRAAAPGSGV